MNTLSFLNPVSFDSGTILRPQIKNFYTNRILKDNQKTKSNQIKFFKKNRLQYISGDLPGNFIVKIIDIETDKIIKEIPPKQIQMVRKYVDQYYGNLVDKSV